MLLSPPPHTDVHGVAAILKNKDSFLLYSLGYVWFIYSGIISAPLWKTWRKKSSEAFNTPNIIRKSVFATSHCNLILYGSSLQQQLTKVTAVSKRVHADFSPQDIPSLSELFFFLLDKDNLERSCYSSIFIPLIIHSSRVPRIPEYKNSRLNGIPFLKLHNL